MAQRPESATRPLAIEDALGALSFAGRTPVVLSPDGELVAYTLQDPARRAESTKDERSIYYSPTGVSVEVGAACDVWITNTRTGQATNLTGARGANWAPTWSPNGELLAFYSDRTGNAQLWIWERRTGQLHAASDAIVRHYFSFETPRWSPDGSRIVFKALPEDLTIVTAADLIIGNTKSSEKPANASAASGATVRVYRSRPTAPRESTATERQTTTTDQLLVGSWSNVYLSDLTVVEVKTGRTTRLVRRVKSLGYWFSPDGARIAYTTHKGVIPNTQQTVFDLSVMGLRDTSPRVIVPAVKMEFGISVSWSPDGSMLAFTEDGQRADGECFLVSSTGGNPQPLRDDGQNFSNDYRAPLWDRTGRYVYLIAAGTLWRGEVASREVQKVVDLPDRVIREVVAPAGGGRYWSPDAGRTIYVSTRDDKSKRVGFYRVDLESRHAQAIVEEDSMYGGIFQIDAASDTVVYITQDAQHPPDLWIADGSLARRRRLTHINPALDRYTFAASRLVEWRTSQGATVRGALLLPPNAPSNAPVPLIVKVYGGSTLSDNVNRFGLDLPVDNLQLLATRGYAVLTPDTSLGMGTPMKDLAETVLPGVEHLVKTGIADPQRLGVMGHSYGGYSTLALITQTTQFRAAVVSAGKGDLIASYGQMARDGSTFGIGWSETGQGRMGGTPWEYPSRYLENSPIRYLDRVETPVLIVHGELDATVPVWLADQVFVGLRRLGKVATYLRYEGEEHWPGTWGPANVADYWSRVLAWFDEYLRISSL